MQNKASLLSYFICCAMLIAGSLFYPKWEKSGTEATLSWDVMGYYLYLPASFIYQDLKQLEFQEDIMEQYRPTSSFYQAYPHENGNYVMKYPVGLAVLYAPFFGTGHVVATITHYPADGFSLPYQAAISWGSLFVAFLGLWVARKNLLHYFDDRVVAPTLLLLLFATNYLEYAAISNAMPHNYLFTLHSLLIASTIQWHKNPNYKWSLAIGVCIGLAALARPTEVIVALIPLLWGIQNPKSHFQKLGKHWQKLLLTALVVAAIGSLQLIYWKYVSGNALEYSYEDQGFNWFKLPIHDFLFSYRKGWFVYTPIMIFAVLGFIPFFKQHRTIFWAALAYFLIHFWITSAWEIWWYGGAFGQRAMIQSFPILIFSLAALLTWILKSKWLIFLFIPIALFCSWLNLFQTWQAHKGGFEVENMTKAYYWRIFANANVTEMDKKLLDTEEDYVGKQVNIDTLNFEDFIYEENYEGVKAKNKGVTITTPRALTPGFDITIAQIDKKWVRAKADLKREKQVYGRWSMGKMWMTIFNGDQVVKQGAMRFDRYLQAGKWTSVWIDMTVPKEPFDKIRVHFENADSNNQLEINNLQLEAFDED